MRDRVLNMEQLLELFPFTRPAVYGYIRRPRDPLPAKRIGKRLFFLEEATWAWFRRQPGYGPAEAFEE